MLPSPQTPSAPDARPGPRPVAPNDMKLYLNIAQILISALLVGSILMQSRGTGLGSAIGGGDGGNVYRTKRGMEKLLFRSTIVLAVAFFGLAIANILVPQTF